MAPAEALGFLLDESSGVGDGADDLDPWSQWCTTPPKGSRPRVPCAPASLVLGRWPRCRCPVRLLVAQPTMRRALRALVANTVRRVPGPGGVSQVDGAGRAARLGQGGADPARPPNSPVLGLDGATDQRDGRSHSATVEKSTRPDGSRPRPQAPGPPSPAPGGAGPPHLVVPGLSPTSIRVWRTQPRRVSGLPPSSFADAPETPPGPIRIGQGPQAPAGLHVA